MINQYIELIEEWDFEHLEKQIQEKLNQMNRMNCKCTNIQYFNMEPQFNRCKLICVMMFEDIRND